jgi:hypothetical protein
LCVIVRYHQDFPIAWLASDIELQVIAPTMTLATMRSYIWKMGGDVVLYYRKKDLRTTPAVETKLLDGFNASSGGTDGDKLSNGSTFEQNDQVVTV